MTFNSLFSQKCRVEDDPFSDERVVSFNYKNKTVFLESKNNEVRLDIEFYYWGEKSYVFEKGASLFLKLENKKTLELLSSNEASSTLAQSGNIAFTPSGIQNSDGRNYSIYMFSFTLNWEQIKKLANSEITHLRIPDIDKRYIDKKAKGRIKKKTVAIKKGAECMISHLQG
ncbi:hypothetical protein [Allomuricauda sp. R78024]|uniref:hypothetical protein n=1 Tax=Allomuricauda sp. R78024 TaxID=3093867 RepID=UPI0037C987DB